MEDTGEYTSLLKHTYLHTTCTKFALYYGVCSQICFWSRQQTIIV